VGEDSSSILRDTAKLAEFFGCSLKNVDGDLIRIARLSVPPPAWLRGISKMAMLPRYKRDTVGDTCEVEINSGIAYAERISWIVENLSFAWMATQNGPMKTFVFAEAQDAVYFRLRWGIA
jgi:hypothetical protein